MGPNNSQGTRETTKDELVQTRDREEIASMFNRIARTYDVTNRIMTVGQDRRWRRIAVNECMLLHGGAALDVATGTGDVARELAKRVAPGGRVVGVDIASAMLDIARRKTGTGSVTYEFGDVVEMEFQNEFDAVTVAFGFRNFANREAAVRTMVRALKPRGRLVILELVPSHGPLRRVVDVYEQQVVPRIGRLVSRDADAYSYLPESVALSTTSEEIMQIMRRCALTGVRARDLNFGTVAVVRGVKPAF
jgi:demethylmenaquinone methyltransferase/2-methoxy-6-polyprenyl-1,4-benzoquinol methylase